MAFWRHYRSHDSHQRPAAYAQFMHTQQQLRRLHVGQKIMPKIIDLLFKGHVERGTTLILVTHDHALAARCDRVVRLRSGRIETADKRAAARA